MNPVDTLVLALRLLALKEVLHNAVRWALVVCLKRMPTVLGLHPWTYTFQANHLHKLNYKILNAV